MALDDIQNGHQLSEKEGFEQSLWDTQTRQVPGGLTSVVRVSWKFWERNNINKVF